MSTTPIETHPLANEILESRESDELVTVRQDRTSRRLLALFLAPLLFLVFAVFPVELAAMIAAGGALAIAFFLAPIWLARKVKLEQDRAVERDGAPR